MNSQNDIFWLEKPSILLKSYLRFIPTKNMNWTQRYNAITLFCIYSMILLMVFKKPLYSLYFPFVVIILMIIINYIKTKQESFDSVDTYDTDNKLNTIIETGFIDSNDELRINRVTNHPTNKTDVTFSCRKPTKDNPFMNPPISDFNKDVPSACNSDDKDISDKIVKSFNSDLYMDIDDVFDKQNSQRQFYTVPNTGIPNNQIEFAKWLYLSPVTCKEDQEQCLRYEDLRFKR